MSNIIKVPEIQLPAELMQGIGLSGFDAMDAGVSGESFPKISLRNSRFSVAQGRDILKTFDNAYLDVIIVGVADSVSRTYYEEAFDPNDDTAPTCTSYNGQFPDQGVNKPQASGCATCPRNQRVPDPRRPGKEHTPCGFSKAAVVVIPEMGMDKLWRLQFNSMTIYDNDPTGNERLFTYKSYLKTLKASKIQAPFQVITRLQMDMRQTVPKLLFQLAGVVGSTDNYPAETYNQLMQFLQGSTEDGENTMEYIQRLLRSGAKETTDAAQLAPPQPAPGANAPPVVEPQPTSAVPGVTGGQQTTTPAPVVAQPEPAPTPVVAQPEPAPTPVVQEATPEPVDPNEQKVKDVGKAQEATSDENIAALIAEFDDD